MQLNNLFAIKVLVVTDYRSRCGCHVKLKNPYFQIEHS